MLLASVQGDASEYTTNFKPACRQLRNVAPGAPRLPERNHADVQAAMPLVGTIEPTPLDTAPEFRRRYAHAFTLLQKIDADDTTALATLAPDTPRIDGLIDRHLNNLVWARSMLGVFYEQGRAPPVDYARAAEFYRKSTETRFVDDRGCTHNAVPAAAVLNHLAGYYLYGAGVAPNAAKARALLQQAGASAILTLLDHNALPPNIKGYLDLFATPARLADRVAAVENPAASDMPDMMTIITKPDAAMATVTAPLETALTWAGLIAAALIAAFAGLWLVHRQRRRLEQKASIYRTAFAAYDVISRIAGRIGLVAGGLIGCGIGFFMLLGASLFGLAGPAFYLILVGGGLALLGGIARLIEAFRVSQAPTNTQVHGAARPAEEPETQAAARGIPKTSSLRDQTFKD